MLPQGVAYALIAGLPPEYGLYTAIVTPVIAGLFGSSLHLVSGPTAAISIVVLSVVSNVFPPDSSEFIPAVLTLTFLTGLVQLGLGFARLGTLVNFISHTVVIGFTAGAAVLIASSQMKYVLGLPVPTNSSFTQTWTALAQQFGETNFYALMIALATMLSTLLLKRINPRLPTMLFGMIVGSLLCWLIDGGSQGVPLVGSLPDGLPGFAVPDFSIDTINALLPGAVAVAILGLVEAVSIARAIAMRSGQRIDGNQEFIGQGLSNTVASFFSCYAGSGSFTRSGVNYESGAQTPVAAIIAALALVFILLLIPEVTSLLPLPAMAGAILLIAWGLIDSHHIRHILRHNRQESVILLVTFTSTLVIELEFAIYLGVILSLVLYLRRTSRPRLMEVAPRNLAPALDLRSVSRYNLATCPRMKIVRIDGSIFFGATDYIQQSLKDFSAPMGRGDYLLIVCSGINFIDMTGAEMMLQEIARLKAEGVKAKFCALKNTVKDELFASGYWEALGPDDFYSTPEEALAAITHDLNKHHCLICKSCIFSRD
ncbi:sulfate permease, SulP family [Modicisalibacter xianhensis]|uniref:Sulfate permease, SulP family n=1 Tax=Modicisalibacter xianhensis TaxID=442341 RepID=A0A1I3GLD1_9GAMM|nr:sulfate permease, SulP family [Halomonas xianhensis]